MVKNRLLLPFVLIPVAFVAAVAAAPQVRPSDVTGTTQSEPRLVTQSSSTLASEIGQAEEEFRAQLARLTSQFLTESDANLALELQRQIQDLKLDTEIRYLEIQTRNARLTGANAVADEGERILELHKLHRAMAKPVPSTRANQVLESKVEQ